MKVLHIFGIPASIAAIVSIDFNTWQGWVVFILSTLYTTCIAIIYGIRGFQSIRRENQAHKIRKQKYKV